MRGWLMAILLLVAAPAAAETPCSLEAPCEVTEGEYALAYPPDWDGKAPLPAMIFFHGHNSDMASTIRSGALTSNFVEKGWLLIAPQGERAAKGSPRRWPGTPNPDWRDDRAYALAVLADVESRVPLAGKPVVAGFSAGGSMAWMMSCYEGSRFAALISVAGALRRPNAEPCPEMAPRAFHIHGFTDSQVPLEGRGIRDWKQGSVAETLAGFRVANGCRDWPDAISAPPGEWRARFWGPSCDSGADLLYVEHDGGHGLPPGWAERAAAWLAAD